MGNLKDLIKESLNELAMQSEMLENAKKEFVDVIQINPITLNVGRGELTIPSSNFTFYIDYVLDSDAYYDQSFGSYDEEPQSEIYNENSYTISFFNITAYNEETDSEVQFIPDNEMMSIIEQSAEVNLKDWENMSSKDEYLEKFR